MSQAKKVIDKNLAVVQKIAYLLGENAAETESISMLAFKGVFTRAVVASFWGLPAVCTLAWLPPTQSRI